MEALVQSLAQFQGVRYQALATAVAWVAAPAQIQSLAQELLYAMGELKKEKKIYKESII